MTYRYIAIAVLGLMAQPISAQNFSRAIPPPEEASAAPVAEAGANLAEAETVPVLHESKHRKPSGHPLVSQPARAMVKQVAIAPEIAEPKEQEQASPAPRLANAPDRLVRCVAQAVYHEARGESYQGQQAVADVVANRARSGRWGDHCGVVNAPKQFSGRSKWSAPKPGVPAWDRAIDIARRVVSGTVLVSSRYRNFRHVSMGGPKGASVIGRHVFW